MLLAPTHEEEITALVSDDVLSEKALPVRLFQIGGSRLALTCPKRHHRTADAETEALLLNR